MPNLLSEAADNYFKSLNPIAEKIAEEIQSVKAACTEWNDLTIIEQEQILNDSIIHPQTLLQYSLTLQNIYGKSGCYFENGLKTVIDEQTGSSWRDEHSAPFSWKTKSLLELCQSSKCVPALPLSDINPSFIPSPPSPDYKSTDVTDSSKVEEANGNTFSHFCAKLKGFPGVSNSSEDKGFLTKIKNNAVSKLQNTLKLVGKVGGPSSGDSEVLVYGLGASIVPRQDKITNVSKPVEPPPPPPRVHLTKDTASIPLLECTNPLIEQTIVSKAGTNQEDDDEILPLSGQCLVSQPEEEPSTIVPKSGFDFLDDW